MKVQVGDYKWRQLSMWDSAPFRCIEKFCRIGGTEHYAHYILERVAEVYPSNAWRVEVVMSIDNVPADVLNWQNTGYTVKGGQIEN